MKTRTKQCGVFAALTAVLFITAALVTSCGDPISPLTVLPKGTETPSVPLGGSTGGTTGAQPPGGNLDIEPLAEVGYLELKIIDPESGARTILPTGVPTIGEYEIVLATTAATPVITTLPRVTSTPASTTVNVGTYNVEVRGYKTVGDTEIVAVGSVSTVEITASGTTGGAKAVTLQEIYTGTHAGEGILSWNFNFTSTNLTATPAGTVTLNVSNWGAATNTIPTTLEGATLSLTNPAAVTGNGTLPSGYYYVDVTLAKTDCRTQTYREIVHIANGLTSNWTKADFVALSKNVYTVTYNSHGGTAVTAETDVAHGTSISAPTPPTQTGFTFDGWYRSYTPAVTEPTPAPEVYAAPWTFTSTEKVISDLTLHAKWAPASTGALQLTVSFTNLNHTEQTFDLVDTADAPLTTITFSNAALYGPPATMPTIVVVLDNASTFPDGITWTYQREGEAELVLSSTATLTIDFAIAAHYNAFSGADEYPITIEGKIGTVPYTTIITLSITP